MLSCVGTIGKWSVLSCLFHRHLRLTFESQPKSVLVQKLIERGTVEALTELKVILVKEASESVPSVPKGEMYSRREPKGKSSFNLLEERLVEDIAGIFISLDTGIVTPDIRAVFKAIKLPAVNLESEQNNFDESSNLTTIQRAGTHVDSTTTYRDFHAKLLKMEADFLLFKGTTNADILKLEEKVKEQSKILEIHHKQISDLLNLSSLLNKDLKRITRASENNSTIVNLCNDDSFTPSTSPGKENHLLGKFPSREYV